MIGEVGTGHCNIAEENEARELPSPAQVRPAEQQSAALDPEFCLQTLRSLLHLSSVLDCLRTLRSS